MFKIDAADYMMSICGNDALRELSSPGKSGSVFFLSQDDRFMIKTLRKSEVKVCPSTLGPNLFAFYILIFLIDKIENYYQILLTVVLMCRFSYGCFLITIIM